MAVFGLVNGLASKEPWVQLCHFSWEPINGNSAGIVNFLVNVCPAEVMLNSEKN